MNDERSKAYEMYAQGLENLLKAIYEWNGYEEPEVHPNIIAQINEVGE